MKNVGILGREGDFRFIYERMGDIMITKMETKTQRSTKYDAFHSPLPIITVNSNSE